MGKILGIISSSLNFNKASCKDVAVQYSCPNFFGVSPSKKDHAYYCACSSSSLGVLRIQLGWQSTDRWITDIQNDKWSKKLQTRWKQNCIGLAYQNAYVRVYAVARGIWGMLLQKYLMLRDGFWGYFKAQNITNKLCFSPGMVRDSDSLYICTHRDKCPSAVSSPLGMTWRSDACKPIRIFA